MSFKCDTCGETVANTFCRCACQRDPQTQAERIAELEQQLAELREALRKIEQIAAVVPLDKTILEIAREALLLLQATPKVKPPQV